MGFKNAVLEVRSLSMAQRTRRLASATQPVSGGHDDCPNILGTLKICTPHQLITDDYRRVASRN
jgi:hypothetical protein